MLPKSTPNAHKALRARAILRLKGSAAAETPFANAPDALRVLHDLASDPATAPQALALLHELQVHQVEVDLQDEELRRTRADMEASLARQIELYDSAPVAHCSIYPDTTLREANRAAARLLGLPHELLTGRTLESFLPMEARATLHGLLAQVRRGLTTAHAPLQLAPVDGALRNVLASVSVDPAGGFLLAITENDRGPAG